MNAYETIMTRRSTRRFQNREVEGEKTDLIIEAGRHDELLARKGKYYQLYTGNQITS